MALELLDPCAEADEFEYLRWKGRCQMRYDGHFLLHFPQRVRGSQLCSIVKHRCGV